MSAKQTRTDAIVLEAIPYPPRTKLAIQLESITKLSKAELFPALSRLEKAGLIDERNGWIFRLRIEKHEPLTRCDE